ncbi:DUF6880 family protein [Phenylobacterium sp.]|uniref:DUF6880 family protein n=1 Tax=Phenylobacterium sp. TaxID=1871053 RepID=UPI0027349BB6|nr:DUF6880 family protein [Phenylobacterium sp.]MDP3635645.1 hypothetical protein [Phenylobacterium sp.]MDP3867229.1 hypothetical protein [Phenylobacterium sp.]
MKRPGSRKTVTAANLADLGAERLAEILLEVAEAQPTIKRRLRMELAGEVGPEDLATEIAKRLTAIETRRSRVHWRKYKEFVRDLSLQRAMITGKMAEKKPALALEFLWRFLDMAEGVLRLTKDEKGEVEAVFLAAVEDLGPIAVSARGSTTALAERAFQALETDEDEIFVRLVEIILPALDAEGIARLRQLLEAAIAQRGRPKPALRAAVQTLADAQGDVDGFIATITASEALQPWTGAQIASRLTATGRAPEALAALKRSAPPAFADVARSQARVVASAPSLKAWEDAYLDALEADGQAQVAQAVRWTAFEQRLSADRLRAYLKRLPDFDDVVAEDKAMAFVATFKSFPAALRFLLAWPAASQAAALVLARSEEIDGDDYEGLEAAALALEGRYPLAASLLYRAMITRTLRFNRRDRFADAERWIADLGALALQIAEFGEFETHSDFVGRMGRHPQA